MNDFVELIVEFVFFFEDEFCLEVKLIEDSFFKFLVFKCVD